MDSHNHPPIKEIVPGCVYCQTHGNVFAHGILKLEPTKLTHMYYFKQFVKNEPITKPIL